MPTKKVGIGAVAGALTAIGVWIASRYGVAVPGEIASAMTTVVYFCASYLITDSE